LKKAEKLFLMFRILTLCPHLLHDLGLFGHLSFGLPHISAGGFEQAVGCVLSHGPD
jgi:hypothetical protein